MEFLSKVNLMMGESRPRAILVAVCLVLGAGWALNVGAYLPEASITLKISTSTKSWYQFSKLQGAACPPENVWPACFQARVTSVVCERESFWRPWSWKCLLHGKSGSSDLSKHSWWKTDDRKLLDILYEFRAVEDTGELLPAAEVAVEALDLMCWTDQEGNQFCDLAVAPR